MTAVPPEPASLHEHPATRSPRFVFEIRPDRNTVAYVADALLREATARLGFQRRTWWKRLGLYVVLASACAALCGWFFRRTSVGDPGVMWLGVALGAIMGVGIARYVRQEQAKDRSRLTRAAADRYAQAAIETGPLRLELWDDGVRVFNGLGVFACRWFAVRGIRRVESIIALELWPDSMIALTPANFGHPTQADELIGFVAQRIAAAGGGEAGLLKRHLAGVDAPCPSCRYVLRGCDGARCPECGLRLTIELFGLSPPRSRADLNMDGASIGKAAPA